MLVGICTMFDQNPPIDMEDMERILYWDGRTDRQTKSNPLYPLNFVLGRIINIFLKLLFSYRYGKPLVFDMLDMDLYETLKSKFDSVQDGLLDLILDRSITKEEQ